VGEEADVTMPISFDQATKRLRSFSASQSLPTEICWTFRDDICQVSPRHVIARWPLPRENSALAAKVYQEAQEGAGGDIDLLALARLRHSVIATAWYPRTEEEQAQGRPPGLRVAIATPTPTATRVGRLLWAIVTRTKWYRRYQKYAFGIGTRSWAVAEPHAVDGRRDPDE
jgi:hypothetical protein